VISLDIDNCCDRKEEVGEKFWGLAGRFHGFEEGFGIE
jgi:hypothetical protein